VPRGVLVLCAFALAACAPDPGGIVGGGRVASHNLTVYSLLSQRTSRDLIDGQKLALADARGRAGPMTVNFASLDPGTGNGPAAAGAARRAINDSQIIAAIADATPVTVPLFNAAGILQVAPGGDLALARDAHALPSGRPTLARVDGGGALPAGFAGRFRAAFGREPGTGAERGYRAMRGVLAAIARLGRRGNDRRRVIDAYLGLSSPATRPG